MITSNFHMHTTFVDGRNTAEEMVQMALEAGMTTIGFSEHAYVPFDLKYSMTPEKAILYRDTIANLKEKYADRIRILCGVEKDYYSEDEFEQYDYIIGSVHYLIFNGVHYSVDSSPKETIRCVQEVFHGDYDSYAECYFEKVAQIAERTKADIIGHFDLLTKFEQYGAAPDTRSERYIKAWKQAMDQLSESKAVIEINTGAMARGYTNSPYPSEEMLQYWHSLGGKVVVSSDAHFADQIAYWFEECEEMVERMRLNRVLVL